ncbi:MAG: serine/threonine protein kinase, partial [Myxococcales bacterium]|nr:serine/threonine protein kinase [Myxococcales bacterium]
GFEKLIVIKRILPQMNQDAAFIDMFLHEARIAATLTHANIVHIFDVGEVDGQFYIAMEHVHGEDIRSVVRQMKVRGYAEFPLEHAVTITLGVCSGLAYAHEKRDLDGSPLNIVHRDISPQNILVAYDGTAKLVDFGIAKATHRSSSLTMEGEIKGKFAYMAPEQVNQQSVDRRTDLFALGILLYTLTTGRHPFRGDTPAATIRNVLTRPVTRPSAIVEDYPFELEALVMRSLRREPAERFQTAHEMLSALERAAPEWLEGSFEASVAAYMRALLGEQASQRRSELRRAQADLDRDLPEPTLSSSSSSYSSLRAITLDPVPTAVGEPGDAESESGSLRSGGSLLSAQRFASPAPSRRWGRAGVAVLGLGSLLVGVGWFVARGVSGPTELPANAAQAAPEAPVAAPEVSAPEAPDAPATAAEEPAPTPSVAPSAEEAAEAAKSSRAWTRGRWAPSAQRPSRQTSADKPEGQAKPQGSDAPLPKGSANAWDPSTFGGRQ